MNTLELRPSVHPVGAQACGAGRSGIASLALTLDGRYRVTGPVGRSWLLPAAALTARLVAGGELVRMTAGGERVSWIDVRSRRTFTHRPQLLWLGGAGGVGLACDRRNVYSRTLAELALGCRLRALLTERLDVVAAVFAGASVSWGGGAAVLRLEAAVSGAYALLGERADVVRDGLGRCYAVLFADDALQGYLLCAVGASGEYVAVGADGRRRSVPKGCPLPREIAG